MISEILTKKNEAIKIIRLIYKIPIDNGNKKSKIISEVNLSHSDENIAEVKASLPSLRRHHKRRNK